MSIGAYVVVFLECLQVLWARHRAGRDMKYLLATATVIFALATAVRTERRHLPLLLCIAHGDAACDHRSRPRPSRIHGPYGPAKRTRHVLWQA